MKRIVVKLAIFLILGAIINVAVAWGFALWQDAMPRFLLPFPYGVSHDGNSTWDVRRVRRSGTDMVVLIPMRLRMPYLAPDADRAAMKAHVLKLRAKARDPKTPFDEVLELPMIQLPYWSQGRTPPDEAQRACLNCFVAEEARGWPMQSLLSFHFRGLGKPGEEWAWHIGGIQSSGLPRQLPLKPIWPGFAINSAINATALWLLVAALFAYRRHRRIKRGLCPACAYDLRGSDSSICPECGWGGAALARTDPPNRQPTTSLNEPAPNAPTRSFAPCQK
jgi:hypothetical protein